VNGIAVCGCNIHKIMQRGGVGTATRRMASEINSNRTQYCCI
jgi:hypothetical protein